MKCIELLNEEHHLILRLLKVIKAMGRDTVAKQAIDAADSESVVKVLDTFVDSIHELKEESALFPLVIERAGEAHAALRARVFEHNQERSLIEGLRESMLSSHSTNFAWCAQRLADLMSEHVRKEYLLFKEFQSLLKPENDKKIVAEFERIDAARRPKLSEVAAIVDELERKYEAVA